MKFQYTYLPHNSIRVFRFSEYATPSFIHIWLEHLPQYPTENASSYTTISCLASSSDDSPCESESIILNGRSFMVPAALSNALRTILAHHREPNGRYWAEAICVNRADEVEQAQRLSMMGLAHKHAGRNWLWVGDENGRISRALAVVRQWGNVSLNEAEQSELRGLLQRLRMQQKEVGISRHEDKEVLICGAEQCSLVMLNQYERHFDAELVATSVL